MFPFSSSQYALVEARLEAKIFLEGQAGTGKTTAGVQRLRHLLDEGIPADSILIIAPQRTLALPYYEALRDPNIAAGGQVDIVTMGGLARRMVDLFWPVVAEAAGFAEPDEPATFLTIESAQYYMARVARPLIEQEYFSSVTIDRNRLYSQILDNLNKAAVVGFPHTEIGARLSAAWLGEESQRRIYADAQSCATRFREYCLAHNLLDFSLQLEVFVRHIWPYSLCQEYLLRRYPHLIVENVEEDTPISHDILQTWLPKCQSALVIYDREAGYRRFLGADPDSAYTLKELCDTHFEFTESFVTSPDIHALGTQLSQALGRSVETAAGDARTALSFETHRFLPQMLDWVAETIGTLVHDEQTPPREIVVLSPFLSDALRFSLMERLESVGVPARSHRPSRSLREEPATLCLLTLAALAHPQWGIRPPLFDVANTLRQAIDGLDLVRAQLLAETLYRFRDGVPSLESFEQLKPEMQARITYVLGERYEGVRAWIATYAKGQQEVLDHFLSRLFGEVLSQNGYGFHRSFDAGKVAANLVESVRKFRWAASDILLRDGDSVGREYLQLVNDGVIAAQYIRSWELQSDDAVLLAPAYTFLMSNKPVEYQFWLNVGSRGWAERLYQPLTHPYVLSRQWPAGKAWTDADEVEANQEALYRLTLGLVRRCRKRIYLGLSELDEQGYEHKGPLLRAIHRMLQRLPVEPELVDV